MTPQIDASYVHMSLTSRWTAAQVVAVERENLRLNRVPGRACQLDWRDRDAAAQLGAFDLILSADLLYASARVKASSWHA